MREDVPRHDGVEFLLRWQGLRRRDVRHPPESDLHVVPLLDREGHEVRRRIDSESLPSCGFKLIQLRSVVARGFKHRPSLARAYGLTNDLVGKPVKVLDQSVRCSRLVQRVRKKKKTQVCRPHGKGARGCTICILPTAVREMFHGAHTVELGSYPQIQNTKRVYEIKAWVLMMMTLSMPKGLSSDPQFPAGRSAGGHGLVKKTLGDKTAHHLPWNARCTCTHSVTLWRGNCNTASVSELDGAWPRQETSLGKKVGHRFPKCQIHTRPQCDTLAWKL